MKYRSPLRYPGGKAKLVNKIYQYAPQEGFTEYREPFLGGGSMLLHVIDDVELARVGDTFWELYNFWVHLKSSYAATATDFSDNVLVNQINFLKSSAKDGRQLHRTCKDILLTRNISYLNKAAAFFILNRISYSGLTMSGGFSQTAYKERFKHSHIQRLNEIRAPLKKVKFHNDHYERLLFASGDDVWIYMDPPYDISSDNLYGVKGNAHKGFDHIKFAEDCKNSPHRWTISYNDGLQIRKLFDWANIHTIPVSYNMNSLNKQKNELVITNY